MKKSLIALAVAGAFAAPAFAATSNVDVYGKMRVSIDHQDTNVANTDSWQLNDQTSRIGFKGSEDLGGGLKAIWQIEQAISGGLNNNFGGATLGGRNTFVGLSGGFGTVLAGRHDTPYKLGGSADVFADTTADAQCSGGLGQCIIGRNGFDTRANNAIAYVSPEFSGFHGAVAIVPGETAGANSPNGLMDAYSMVGVYKNGPLNASLAYENYDKTMGVAGAEDKDAWKLNLGYKIGDIGLGYTYESSDPGYAANQKKDKGHLLSATYGMGPITLLAQYGQFDDKNTAHSDFDRWTVGAAYGLSKRTSVYAAYHSSEQENGVLPGSTDLDVWTFGMNHDF